MRETWHQSTLDLRRITLRTLAAARLKRVRALELAADGMSYDEVARAVGFRHRASAFRAVHKALDEREVAGVDELRALELVRLDRLQAALWDKAMTGDTRAINGVTRIVGQRARLLGLYQAAPAHPDVTPQVLIVGPGEGNQEKQQVHARDHNGS